MSAPRKRTVARGSAAYPRKRSVTACQVCRRRRTKCDNKKPTCSFCQKIGANCVTAPVDFSSFDTASLEIIDRLDRLETLLESGSTTPRQRGEQDHSADTTDAILPQDNITPSHDIHNTYSLHPLRLLFTEVLTWPVFRGQWASQANEMTMICPGDKPSLALSTQTTSSLDAFWTNPNAGDELLSRFIQHVHIKNPILEMSALRTMIRHVSLEGLAWDAESCLVLLVWALGAIASPFKDRTSCDRDSLELSKSLFSAASKRLGTLLSTGGILASQCFFFSGVYLMSVFKPVSAWRNFLQALACCQEFEFAAQAFHEPQTLQGPSDTPAMEQRLYWSCWKSEVELRMCLGLFDFQVQDRVYPGHFPTPPAHPDLDNRAWFFYLAEISLRRLNTRARNKIGHVPQPSDPSTWERLIELIANYERQAEAWLESLPQMINLQTPPEDDDMLKSILRCHIIDFRELIYWTPVTASINQWTCPAAVDSYSSLALENAVDRMRVGTFSFRHRHHGTWLLLQSCTRSALLLLAASKSPNARELLPMDWKVSVSIAVDMMEYWSVENTSARHQLLVLRELCQEAHITAPTGRFTSMDQSHVSESQQ
jgi:hypothetical protein